MTADLTALPARTGARPTTTGLEIPHDQLEAFSPPRIRSALIEFARSLPGVLTGPSAVSEPGSLAFRMPRRDRDFDAFLHPSVDEFGHVHRSGFMHLTVPASSLAALIDLGWVEPHPISRRPEFPGTIVMFYAPRDTDELTVATAVLQASYDQAAA
ncbi:luciferase family protein [Nocardia sp. NPDC050793]|uniref:luciferase domain-containing protein n=1 Tax=Nocardia sp. NPDC050793 TaxID=3155159 RepID=UPI0033D67DE6